jgi:hypothetical protein
MRELSPLAANEVEVEGTDSAAFRVDAEWLVFSAYRMLEGEPLSDAALASHSRPVRDRALDQLAAVLEAIHRFPIVRARPMRLALARRLHSCSRSAGFRT